MTGCYPAPRITGRQEAQNRHDNENRHSQVFAKHVYAINSCSSYVCRVINNPEANAAGNFANNEVVTSKYTALNFIPLFLYENLNPVNKFANFYFLCVACLEVSPTYDGDL